MATKSQNTGGENPEFILRDFGGMNCLAAREDIEDNEFYWCENAIPVAAGALYPVYSPSPIALATIAGEVGAPTYTTNFNVTGTDYAFGVWSNSGNGWIVNLSSFATTQIGTGLWTSGQTSATQYSNQGLLIIDPAGYWDWNITTANTLTPQNNGAAIPTLIGTANTFAGGSSIEQVVTGTGTGATFQTLYQVVSALLTSGGTGYAVGDTINLTDGSPTTTAQIIVATISGGGATGPITAITLAAGGSYPGPVSGTIANAGPTGSVITTTGGGTGASFTCHVQATSLTVLTRGTGYTAPIMVVDETIHLVTDQWSVSSSGVIGGTSIATYAGRVWLALSRTVYFTDIDSYSSFGGVGGSFFIPDAYLHNNVTALYAANNYLYIFGDTSIDALSNVTVTAGVTYFSRINVTASVGTSTPTSIFAYYRAIVFYHASGFYLLAGATPEKISDKISGIIPLITAVSGIQYPLVYGGQVLVEGELCAAFQFVFSDDFTQGGTERQLLALFFRGRWWVASITPYARAPAMFSVSRAGIETLFAWNGNGLYQVFSGAPLANWLLKTKFWDGGAPTHEKQAINAAIGGQWGGSSPSGVQINVDTETGASYPAVHSPLPTVTAGYHLNVTAANEGGTQYLGLTLTGSTNMTQIQFIAMRAKQERDKLQ